MKKYLYRLWQWVWKGIPVQKINAGITTIEHGNTLAGQKILITGGSRGIGYILAKRFIAEGAAVLIVSRNEGTLQKAATELGCKCMAFDVTNIDQLPELIQKSAEALSGLTGLVNKYNPNYKLK